jgi:hypothetical protein
MVEPEGDHHHDHPDDDGEDRHARHCEPGGRHVTGEHDELALREVDGLGRLVDEHEAQRDQ